MVATKNRITVEEQGSLAKHNAPLLANAPSQQRNAALDGIKESLIANSEMVLAANRKDLILAESSGKSPHLTERMTLNEERLHAMANSVRHIAEFTDPVGQVLEARIMPNGLRIEKVRTPLGVIGAIFESRPNVVVDIASLAIKSGNGAILRGGSDCILTNLALMRIVKAELEKANLPTEAIQFVDDTDRTTVQRMLKMEESIDLLIPRGSEQLVRLVADNASMPAITGGVGVCHTYVDKDADLDMATAVVLNAKTQRYTVCNALDTLLVHSDVAEAFLSKILPLFSEYGVEIRADAETLEIAVSVDFTGKILLSSGEDYATEFLALIANVKIVDSLDSAMRHIADFGSNHSEAIITRSASAADRFLREVDAAAVFHNASTRFNDGGELGLGAEVAVSTGKFHARGPMGIAEICSYKWVVRGNGNIR